MSDIAEQASEIERLRGIVPEVLERPNDELCAENEAQRADAERLRAADCDGGTCGLGGYCAKCKKAGGKAVES